MSKNNVRLTIGLSPLPGAVALTAGDQVLGCGLQETHSNRVGDEGIPLGALEALLKRTDLTREAITLVHWVGDPRLDFDRLVRRALLCFPHLNGPVLAHAAGQIEQGYLTPNSLVQQQFGLAVDAISFQDPVDAWAAAAIGLLDPKEQLDAAVAVLNPVPGAEAFEIIRFQDGSPAERVALGGMVEALPALLRASYLALGIERGDMLKTLTSLATSCTEDVAVDLSDLLGNPGSGFLARRSQTLHRLPDPLSRALLARFGLHKPTPGSQSANGVERARAAKAILAWIHQVLDAELTAFSKRTGCERMVLAGLAGHLPPIDLPGIGLSRDQRPLGLTAVLGAAANAGALDRPIALEEDTPGAIQASGFSQEKQFQAPEAAAEHIASQLASGQTVALYWGPWALDGTPFGAGIILKAVQDDAGGDCLLISRKQASERTSWLDRPTALGPVLSGYDSQSQVLVPLETADAPFGLQVLHRLSEAGAPEPLSARPFAMPNEPPVSTAQAALRALAYSDVDLLLLYDGIVTKRIIL